MTHAARGELRVDGEQVPLDEVENAWQRDQHGRRIVLIPRTISETWPTGCNGGAIARVLGFGLLQNGDVGIGTFPRGPKREH